MEPAFLLPLESESEDDIERHSLGYLTGVLLCLYTATVVSLANILQVRLMSRPQGEEASWTSHHLMIVSGQSPPYVQCPHVMTPGVWSVLLALLSLPLLPAPLLSSPHTLVSAPGLALLGSGLLTLTAVWLTVSAVSVLQRPTLVTMLRSTEICLSLVSESLYWGHAPHPASALGSLLVKIFLILYLYLISPPR